MPNQLDAQLTPADPAEVAGAFVWAYTKLFSRPPNKNDWLFPLAQSALETAHWTAMWNYNAGNVTTFGDYVILPGNGLHFKPYDTLGDGCLDMLHWLNSHGVMPYADDGDLSGYVDRLQAVGYAGAACDANGQPKGCTNYAAYQAGMSRYIVQYGNLNPAGYVNSFFPNLSTKKVVIAALAAGAVAYLYENGDLDGVIRSSRRALGM